ncbi:hypothetical protein POM88_051374 [Heracleum sosnowskyi]|uniref:Uncharacterized protein n=1 Tax=Heracleum sosnowskyi TaxID=360622 RepID=A0AAD8H0H7_9APIA|nr:hypothetical protein POM88_051374 [Heracleum sosnowskyi]
MPINGASKSFENSKTHEDKGFRCMEANQKPEYYEGRIKNNVFSYMDADTEEDIEESMLRSVVAVNTDCDSTLEFLRILRNKGLNQIRMVQANNNVYRINKEDKSEWSKEEVEVLKGCCHMVKVFSSEDLVIPRIARVRCSGISVHVWVEANLKAYTRKMGAWYVEQLNSQFSNKAVGDKQMVVRNSEGSLGGSMLDGSTNSTVEGETRDMSKNDVSLDYVLASDSLKEGAIRVAEFVQKKLHLIFFEVWANLGFQGDEGDADSVVDRLWQKKKAEIIFVIY